MSAARGFFSRFARLHRHKSVAFGALVLGVSSLLSRVIGLIRDRLLSGMFGASGELDAYLAAFRMPDFIYNLVVLGAVTAGFIPVYAAVTAPRERDKVGAADRRGEEFASRLLTLFFVVLGALAIVAYVFAPQLVPMIVHGFDDQYLALTVQLTRVMLLSPFFLGISAVCGGVLQSKRRFFAYSLAPILYNCGIIAGTVFFGPTMGVLGVAWGVAIGAFVHAAIQFVACIRSGFHFSWLWDLGNSSLRKVLGLMLPRTFGMAISQANTLILTGLASTIGVGSIAVFTFANNLQSLPVGVLGVSFAVSAFPMIAEYAAQGKKEELRTSFAKIVRMILFVIIPATIAMLLLRAQLVRLAFGAGRFDWEATIMTMDTLTYFALSIFAQALIPLLARVFFALDDVVTPLLIGVGQVVLERVLAWKFVALGMGTPGLAFAISISTIAQLMLLWLLLRRRVGELHEYTMVRGLTVITVAGLAMAFVIHYLTKPIIASMVDMQTFMGVAAQVAGSLVVGGVVYLGVGLIARSPEAAQVVELLRRRAVPDEDSQIMQEGEKLEA